MLCVLSSNWNDEIKKFCFLVHATHCDDRIDGEYYIVNIGADDGIMPVGVCYSINNEKSGLLCYWF